jgi:hypothetical protein
MKVCIFQGLEIYHYEMIGYLAEYFINNNIHFEIISNKNEISLEWENYYNLLFNKNINWIQLLEFDHTKYNYIFLTSDDDPNYKINHHIFNDICFEKIICIDHHYLIRNFDVFNRISVRFFINRPKDQWILPCYNGISKQDKQKLINNENKIIVTYIGKQYPKSFSIFKNIFINFDDIEFNIISRHYNNELDNINNIKIFKMCPTELMINIVSKSNYIFCNEDLKEYEKQKMSGVLPLSFSYGCQLIIPESWNKFYSFTSAIEYNKTTKILLNKNTNLDDIYNELYVLQNHKQDIISNILNIPKKYDIPIINFINDLGFKIPLILIDFKSNINLEEYKKNFIEIHTQVESIRKNNFIYEHDNQNKLINFMIYNISKPVIIYLDFNNYVSNINELFDLIKKLKRLLNDIIIIKNIIIEDDIVTKIKKAIKKIVWSNIHDNSLIIIPQII